MRGRLALGILVALCVGAPSVAALQDADDPFSYRKLDLRITVEASPATGEVRVSCAESGFPVKVCPGSSPTRRPLPLGSASMAGPEDLPETITIELWLHWGGADGASWARVCESVDDGEPVCARHDAALPAGVETPDVLALAADLEARLPGATLPARPEPEQPGDVRGVATISTPEDRPLVSSSWTGSGGVGEWSVAVESPSVGDVLSPEPPEAPGSAAPPDAPTRSEPPTATAAPAPSRRSWAPEAATLPQREAEDGPAPAARPSGVAVRPTTSTTAPPPPTTARLAAIAVAGAVAALLGALALFARLQARQLADQATRRRILDLLRASPGQTAAGVARALALHPNTVRYHLRVMAKSSHVAAVRSHGRIHHFVAGGAAAREADALAALHAAPMRALYEAVASNPGARVGDLCRLTRARRNTMHYRVRMLEEAGLIRVQREGRALRLFARGGPA